MQNDQFLTPFVQIGYDGARFLNESIKELLINPTDQPPTLGRYFLTAAYLMVNHDSNTFTMWQGNPSSSSNLVTVMSEKAAESCGNVSGVVQPSATADTTPSASATGSGDSSPSGSGTNPSTGAIAGGTVGGVALLAAVALAAFFLLRKRRQKPSQPMHELSDDKPALNAQAVQRQEGEAEIRGGLLANSSVLSHELDSAKPRPELPLYNDRFEIDGTGNGLGSPPRGNSHAAYEMDGRIYTFQP